jgi:hypothetical protein
MLSQGEQAYRQAVRYLRSVQGKEVPADEIAAVVGLFTAMLDRPHNESVARLLDLLDARARPAVTAAADTAPTAAAVLAANEDVFDAIDDVTVTAPGDGHAKDLGELVAKAGKHGFGDLSTLQVLAVVLVVLLTVGLPFAQVQSSPEVQSLMADEEATIGIGIAITLAIVQSRKK